VARHWQKKQLGFQINLMSIPIESGQPRFAVSFLRAKIRCFIETAKKNGFFFSSLCIPVIFVANANDICGKCQRCLWHMPAMSVAYANDICGICQRIQWQMPRIMLTMLDKHVSSFVHHANNAL